jgi:spoIIIJ-associated protein
MKEIEISAPTVEEAIGIALDELGLTENQVEVSIVRAGRGGVFGIGGEDAIVQVRALDEIDGPQPGNEADPPADDQDDDEPPRESEGVWVTRQIIQGLLEAMDLEGEVMCLTPDDPDALYFNIQGDDLGILIGRRGQTLAALQYLVRLMVAHRLKIRLPIYLDVEGYRERRNEKLENLAQRLASQVRSRRETFTMRPMSAFERRIIHVTLAELPGVTTQSIGTGEGRRVVISPER